jgi:hypothetical protein
LNADYVRYLDTKFAGGQRSAAGGRTHSCRIMTTEQIEK